MALKHRFARTLAAIILGVSGVQGAAYAACTQADGAGSWQAYFAITTSGTVWTLCRLSINSVGTIATNTCTRSDGATVGSMVDGTITLVNAARCTYTGSFYLGGLLYMIRHSTLSRDKISVEGVGTLSGGIFSFNLTKL